MRCEGEGRLSEGSDHMHGDDESSNEGLESLALVDACHLIQCLFDSTEGGTS